MGKLSSKSMSDLMKMMMKTRTTSNRMMWIRESLLSLSLIRMMRMIHMSIRIHIHIRVRIIVMMTNSTMIKRLFQNQIYKSHKRAPTLTKARYQMEPSRTQ
jgi:hypothetical protein